MDKQEQTHVSKIVLEEVSDISYSRHGKNDSSASNEIHKA